jgi:predicted amidophosphoribosyltransferase
VALGYKRGAVQRLVLAAKDAVEPGAVTLLGRLLAGFLAGPPFASSYDLLVPVPFHERSLRGRRAHPLTAVYLDAAPVLCHRLPCDDLAPPLLVQVRDMPPRRGLTERERWSTVRGAFALGFRTRMLRGARVLLLDDVMTTGATLSECARVLHEEAGAATVEAVVLVRQPWRFCGTEIQRCAVRSGPGDLTIPNICSGSYEGSENLQRGYLSSAVPSI